MNRHQLIEYHAEITAAARKLMQRKNHDYAGDDAKNPWMNFERSEIMGVCKTEQAFMVRILDKVSRLITFIDAGELQVKEEGVQDSIIDIINYMVLFGAFIEDQKGKETPHQGEAGFLTEEELAEDQPS